MGDLLQRVEVAGRVAASRAADTEALRRLPDDVAAAIVDTGLLRAWVPARYGGAESGPLEVLDAIEALAFHDGAAGWCAMIGATTALTAAHLPPEFAEQIYGDPAAVTGGFAMPAGTGRRVEGGLVVERPVGVGLGHPPLHLDRRRRVWSRARARRSCSSSGSRSRSSTRGTSPGSGARAATTTSSPTALVPEGRWVHIGADPVVDGAVYRMPFLGMLALGVSSVALGLARRAQAELVALAADKRPTGSSRSLAERPVVQVEVAKAEAAWRSARAFVREVVGPGRGPGRGHRRGPSQPPPRRHQRHVVGGRRGRPDVPRRGWRGDPRVEPDPAGVPRRARGHPARHGRRAHPRARRSHGARPAHRHTGAVTPMDLDEYAAAAGALDHLVNPIGIGWAGPTLVVGGTPEQQDRWLPGILDGSAFWCQLFSEPDAGSDLASLQTRAVRDGEQLRDHRPEDLVDLGEPVAVGILLARTDPSVPKHQGISYFVLDMTAPGIEVRPIIEMTGGNHFNEVFLDGVVVPADQRIGEEGEGWRLARVTLANERDSLSKGGVLWGMGPTTDDLFALDAFGADDGPFTDPVHGPVRRQRAAAIRTRQHVLEHVADPSVRKTLADEHGQHVMAMAKDLRGSRRDARRAVARGRGARRLALGLPVQPSAHHRRRHQRGAAHDHRRAAAGPPEGTEGAGGRSHEAHHPSSATAPCCASSSTATATTSTGSTASCTTTSRCCSPSSSGSEHRASRARSPSRGRAFSAGGDFDWFPTLQNRARSRASASTASRSSGTSSTSTCPSSARSTARRWGSAPRSRSCATPSSWASRRPSPTRTSRVGIVAGDGGTGRVADGPRPHARQALPADRRRGGGRRRPAHSGW